MRAGMYYIRVSLISEWTWMLQLWFQFARIVTGRVHLCKCQDHVDWSQMFSLVLLSFSHTWLEPLQLKQLAHKMCWNYSNLVDASLFFFLFFFSLSPKEKNASHNDEYCLVGPTRSDQVAVMQNPTSTRLLRNFERATADFSLNQ